MPVVARVLAERGIDVSAARHVAQRATTETAKRRWGTESEELGDGSTLLGQALGSITPV